MEWLGLIILAAITFGICFLADKGFTKVFRSAPQQHSGLSVRLNKHIGGIGTAVFVLGVVGALSGIGKDWLILAGGCFLVLTGLGLIVYYMAFGVYYDESSFVLCAFGKRAATYRYEDIRCQQLFIAYGKTVVELYLVDGRTVQLQQSMMGVDKFLDKAFAGWLTQKGLAEGDCPFHDPANSCWFPPLEE